MQTLLVVSSFCLALTMALSYDVVHDQRGEYYYLVPVSRVRRGTADWNVEQPGKLDIHYRETLFNNDKNRLDATAYASKNFVDHHDPPVTGGKLEYNHVSGSSVSAIAEHTRHQGTDLGLQGKYNVYKNGPFHVDVTGDYSRHYGGPGGTQHPSYKTMLSGTLDY